MPWSERNSSEALFSSSGEKRPAQPLFSAGAAEVRPLDPIEGGSPAAAQNRVATPQQAAPGAAPGTDAPLSAEELQAQVEAFRAAEGDAPSTPQEPAAEVVPQDQYDALVAERNDLLRERDVLMKQVSDREQHLATGIAALDAAAQALRDRSTEAVVRLASLIARRVTERELEMDPRLAAELSANALDQLDGFASAEVRVHPTDYSIVREQLERNTGQEGPAVRVTADGDIARGGCLVSTDGAEVDGRLDTRFERLEESLLEAMTAAVARPTGRNEDPSDREALGALRATTR